MAIRKRKHRSHIAADTPTTTAAATAAATTTAAITDSRDAMPTAEAVRYWQSELLSNASANNFTHNFLDLQNLLNFNEAASNISSSNNSSSGNIVLAANLSSTSSAIKLTNGSITDTLLGTILTTATATVAPAASSLISRIAATTTTATVAAAAAATSATSATAATSTTHLALVNDATSSTYYASLLNMSPATTSLITAAAATKSYNDSILRWEQLDGSVDFGFDPLYRHSLAMSIVYCVAYIVVFVVGLIGNSFVIAVVLRAPRMRTVTNYFIVNLAIADILVIVFCLPATLIGNIFVRK
ncbi:hypothetical protein AWZ03_012046 [Drosophila navojoa]|uniref:G-protein coupled receptors family 1 profile domain-containing protein n=1 Tax=Drosophila navojoa TaxID=7232 RepID=A0A484AZV7_DRONA|nr:hypothetical protein AWZ03_012046 [Drosophila navojoa]